MLSAQGHMQLRPPIGPGWTTSPLLASKAREAVVEQMVQWYKLYTLQGMLNSQLLLLLLASPHGPSPCGPLAMPEAACFIVSMFRLLSSPVAGHPSVSRASLTACLGADKPNRALKLRKMKRISHVSCTGMRYAWDSLHGAVTCWYNRHTTLCPYDKL